MSYNATILKLLQCPACRGALTEHSTALVCVKNQEHQYPIRNGVIRFVDQDTGGAYNTHWQNSSRNQVSLTKLQHGINFSKWMMDSQRSRCVNETIFLDVGCGDGNHLQFLPAESLKIALDYSFSVDITIERYKNVKNVFIIQADANCIPIRNEVIDCIISYGCFNCLNNPKDGINESCRVLKYGGFIGIWGYGTSNIFVIFGLIVSRKIYRFLKYKHIKRLFVYTLVPFLWIVKNSTEMNLLKNSFRECVEIISTNLVSEHLHIMNKKTWKDYVPANLKYIGEYDLFCGQKFQKL